MSNSATQERRRGAPGPGAAAERPLGNLRLRLGHRPLNSGLSLEPKADPETAERIRKQPRRPGSGERRHQGVREPAVCAEAMAAAAPAAAGEDGRRWLPGAGT